MAVTPEQVLQALSSVTEPERGRDIVRLGMVKGLAIEGERVSFTIFLKDPRSAFAQKAPDAARRAIHDALGDHLDVQIETDSGMIGLGDDVSLRGAETTKNEPGVQNIIAVASGKGGVGKSTVAVNLAVALAQQGYEVGLADTDIYGPSIPTMFGITDEKPRVSQDRKILPLKKYGVKLLSMGFMVDPNQAVIWRGPMVSSAVKQFLNDTAWGDLDYLILDLPPGTGDIQLTIVQTVSLTGAIVVSTPQEVALADARKGVAMFNNVNVPVLGIVENMAYFTPPDLPDRKYYLFGQGGARSLAGDLDVPFLGEIPLEQQVRETGDSGTPVVALHPESAASQAFDTAATNIVAQIARRNAEQPATPPIEILYR